MTVSPKIAAFSFVLVWMALGSSPAPAAILRSSNGMPVLTKDGNCVTTGWQGSEDCAAAKAAAGLGGTQESAANNDNAHDQVVYFDFNKSTLTPNAMHHLDGLAHKLHFEARHGHALRNLTVIGYADRIGNAEYNKKLALRRANTVRAYLISKGAKAKISVRSLGKTEPRAECSADLPRAKLIQCLREDRRADIEFSH